MNKADVERLYRELITRFTSWAQTQTDIRAAVVVGSRARSKYPADEWADLDIIMLTTDPERYLSRTDWLETMEKPLLTFVEPTATGNQKERRVLFKGMLDVDFSIIPAEWIKNLLEHGLPSEMRTQLLDTVGRGMHVLLDKEGVIGRMNAIFSLAETAKPCPPTEHEFLEVVNDFLYHGVFIAKHLKRGELWWALTCLDCYMQRLLLQMITWDAQVTKGWNYDTWFRGRFLERWADPTVLKGLREAFARYDEADAKRGLLETMELFRAVAEGTAKKLDYAYPAEANSNITKWIGECLTN